MTGYEAGVRNTSKDGSFDYLDAIVDVSNLPRGKSLGGLSGGGLWKVWLFDSPSGGIEPVPLLRGVAFYEFPLNSGHRVVRSHGIESIRAVAREIQVAKLCAGRFPGAQPLSFSGEERETTGTSKSSEWNCTWPPGRQE